MKTWIRHGDGMLTDGQGVWIAESPEAFPYQAVATAVAAGEAEIVDYEPPSLNDRQLRALAYRNELGGNTGDFLVTLVLDVVLAQVEATRLHAGASRTPEFDALLTKVAEIEIRHPKSGR